MNSFFNDNKNTLMNLSKDCSIDSMEAYMTTSNILAVDFDLVKQKYLNGLKCTEESAKSVDAVLADGDQWYFIEFKNGEIDQEEIIAKVKDSLLIWCDLEKKHIKDTRVMASFILVYNEEKKKFSNRVLRAIHLAERGGFDSTHPYPRLMRLKDYCLKKVHIYNRRQFDKWSEGRQVNT